jgi:signal transduction histidine kinase
VQIFEDVVRAVKTLGDEKRIQIHLSYDKDICLMYGDYDRLRQMFLVICDNAIKFSKEESSIYITIESSDRLTVKIRGCLPVA